jgi:predicted transcriptional regulator
MSEVKYRQLMEDSLLIRYLGDSPRLRIVDYLLYFPLNDFTKKEILQEVGMSKQTFYKYFDEMIKEEMVTPTRRIARATLYKINKQHPVVRKLDELATEVSLKIADQEKQRMEKKPIAVRAR